jgi:parallel beta-helix repeat protein
VEVSTRAHSLLAQNVIGVQIKNLTFRHGNTSPTGRDAVVTVSGQNNVVDAVQILQCDSVGLEVDGDNNQIISSTADKCGQLGMKARGNNVKIVNSTTSYNNTRGFNKWWEAGGIKLTGNDGLINSVITGHTAIGNNGDGIWFDWGNQNNVIQNSLSQYNTGFGIQYEASSGAQIVGNRIIGNGQRGIYLPQSSNSVIRNNLIAGNALEGVAIIAESRTDPSGQLDLQPINNTVINNVFAWNGYSLTVPGPGFSVAANGNLYVGKGVQLRNWDSWSLPFDNFALWKQHTGLDLQSEQVQLSINPSFASSVQSQQENPDLSWVKSLPTVTAVPLAAAK